MGRPQIQRKGERLVDFNMIQYYGQVLVNGIPHTARIQSINDTIHCLIESTTKLMPYGSLWNIGVRFDQDGPCYNFPMMQSVGEGRDTGTNAHVVKLIGLYLLEGPEFVDFGDDICSELMYEVPNMSQMVNAPHDQIPEDVALAHENRTRLIFNASGGGNVIACRMGPYIDNQQILCRLYKIILSFSECNIKNAVYRAMKVNRFLELCCGRPQELLSCFLVYEGATAPSYYKLHIAPTHSRVPRYAEGWCAKEPNMILSPGIDLEEFQSVYSKWLDSYEEWSLSRDHLFTALEFQGLAGPERLIIDAHLFDQMPASTKPKLSDTPADIVAIVEAARKSLKALGKSDHRSQAFSTLNFITKVSLRQVIESRLALIPVRVRESHLPLIGRVIKEAVKMRNAYVHGPSDAKSFSVDDIPSAAFFGRALEFIFVVSELVELGWSFENWLDRLDGEPNHPLQLFLEGYPEMIGRFKSEYFAIYGEEAT